jgi:hypothetical protein
MPVELDELVVADEPESWEAAGCTVDADGVTRVGQVRVRLVGRGEGKRIRSWSFRDVAPTTTELDGLPTSASDAARCEPAEHPNGVLSIDHVVLFSPDAGRTTRAFEAAGIEVRRVREVDPSQYGFPAVQTFFRAGEAILELLGGTEPTPDAGPAQFFGLAYTVSDLDALALRCGDSLGNIKDAVQPGRRIATLRHKTFDMSVATAFMTPEP